MISNEERRKQTHKKIIDAFFELYREKPLKEITVGAISKTAHVNRTTFYNHFLDIYDLLDEAEDALLDEMSLISETISGADSTLNPTEIFAFGEDLLDKYGEKIGILLVHGDSGFTQKMLNIFKPIWNDVLGSSIPEEDRDLVISYVLSGITGYIVQIYREGLSFKSRKLVDKMRAMMMGSIVGVQLESSTGITGTMQFLGSKLIDS